MIFLRVAPFTPVIVTAPFVLGISTEAPLRSITPSIVSSSDVLLFASLYFAMTYAYSAPDYTVAVIDEDVSL